MKILAPLADNPNAPNKNNTGETPINYAAHLGLTEMVKILLPWTDNPNAPKILKEKHQFFSQPGMVIQI